MYKSIMVPLDGSPFAEQALAPALAIAEKSGAKITLVRAWDPASYRYTSELTPPLIDPEAHARQVATLYLADIAARLRLATRTTIEASVVPGSAVDAITGSLTTVNGDLVVMTTHGLTGWNRAWVGSVADALVRVVTVPVLLCRPSESPGTMPPGRFARVLIPLDGSDEAEQILAHAAAIGGDARFILVRVVRPIMTPVHPYAYAAPAWEMERTATEEVVARARDYLNAKAQWLASQCPRATVDIDVRLAERASTAIVDAAHDYDADLVAATTHARRAVRLVLGSVADKVLRGTHGSVLVLRPVVAQESTRASEHAMAGTLSGTVF